MKFDLTPEGLLVMVPETGVEEYALREWHQKTIGLQCKFLPAIMTDGIEKAEVSTLVFANTEELINVLEELEPEDD